MRRLILLIPALLATVTVGACGSGGSTDAPTTTTTTTATSATGGHNAADITFAQRMIPHHRQAVEMAELAPSHTRNPQVRSLAQQIRAAQAPEIATMVGWLTGWGQPTAPPATTGDSGRSMGDHGMAGSGMADDGMTDHGIETDAPEAAMDGMMSSADMTALRNATGPAFDEMFLAMMIEHHQGAVAMAKAEIRDGLHAPAKQLAVNIQRTQATEIISMQDLLTRI
ncbi:DUF305 domain-containing protein [Frankia sp. AiPs1]|uniref:DUF305 domain-containing protein n=1 Tax=Frankia sp. AiPs1 TaxID=573493 RepID=UPI0020447CEC|nr:DUF305 domain-containing protein [Frankia sp. AiPs1]MCM3921779.1 DUF305 domain-containing protein [Frankia sp. AiPs1]